MIRDDVYVYIGEIMQRQGCALSLGIRHFRNRASPHRRRSRASGLAALSTSAFAYDDSTKPFLPPFALQTFGRRNLMDTTIPRKL